jgi:hypothetical protein
VEIAAFVVSLALVAAAAGGLYYKRKADKREEDRWKAAMTSELVEGGAIPPEWEGRRAYRFRIKNKGGTQASDVDAWLIDQDDQVVSEEAAGSHARIAGLAPDETREAAVVVRNDVRDQNPLRLKVTWFSSDAKGQAHYVSKVTVPDD